MKAYLSDAKTRKACKIYGMLETHARKKHYSFHTPGHKVGKWDITELSFSDNLAAPRGCIAEAEEDIARIVGARASFILTDGSTSGISAMLLAAKKSGVKTLAALLPLHKSVYNACALLDIKLLTNDMRADDQNAWDAKNGKLPSWLKKADALFLTSPDYYGHVPPLSKWKTLCAQAGIPLLIDGAHGGHLHEYKNVYAGTYADMWVDGVHKCLPAFTQGAVVSAKTEKFASLLSESVDVFRTTSPSYPIMASVEYAVKYPSNPALERDVRAWCQTTPRLEVHEDYTKLCALFGENAFSAQAYLESQGIFAEFCDGNRICFYLSPATKLKTFSLLKKQLKKTFTLFPYAEKASVQRTPAPVLFDENAPKEWVAIERAAGRVAAVNFGLFPPCTPLVCAGERITKEDIRTLQAADNVFGVWQNKVCVLQETQGE